MRALGRIFSIAKQEQAAPAAGLLPPVALCSFSRESSLVLYGSLQREQLGAGAKKERRVRRERQCERDGQGQGSRFMHISVDAVQVLLAPQRVPAPDRTKAPPCTEA